MKIKTTLVAVLLLATPWIATAQHGSAPADLSPDSQLAADLAENREIAKIYDTVLATEQRDDRWADATERRVSEVLEPMASDGVSLLDVRCATSFCRANVLHNAQRANDGFVEDLSLTAPFNTAGWIRIHEDEQTVSIYFQREGYSLPPLSSDQP